MTTRAISWTFGLALVIGCGTQPDDAKIVRTVEEKLSAETSLREDRIEVASQNGAVTLNGEVDTATDRSRAAEVAERVEGVVSVSNQIAVTPQPAEPPPVATPPPTEPTEPMAAPETPTDTPETQDPNATRGSDTVGDAPSPP